MKTLAERRSELAAFAEAQVHQQAKAEAALHEIALALAADINGELDQFPQIGAPRAHLLKNVVTVNQPGTGLKITVEVVGKDEYVTTDTVDPEAGKISYRDRDDMLDFVLAFIATCRRAP